MPTRALITPSLGPVAALRALAFFMAVARLTAAALKASAGPAAPGCGCVPAYMSLVKAAGNIKHNSQVANLPMLVVAMVHAGRRGSTLSAGVAVVPVQSRCTLQQHLSADKNQVLPA